MAERIVSPAVFTQERDQTFLAQGIQEMGAAFVGPTAKGPAFVPVTVTGLDGFVQTFGETDGVSYVSYAAKNYLREAGSATVVRVLGWAGDGTKGYTTQVANIYVSGSSGSVLYATLHPNVTVNGLTSVAITGNTGSFSLTVSGSGSAPSIALTNLSLAEGSPSFVGNAFGSSPTVPSSTNGNPAYVYAIFPNALTQAGTGALTLSASINTLTKASDFSHASTPWIKSQPIGSTTYQLFRLHTLGDGVVANKDVKISVTGVSPSTNPDSPFGTFSIIVRAFNDTDTSLNVLEDWSNLTLDPSSPNYIARRIGNSAPVFNTETRETNYEGDFPNLSRYIRVEMTDNVVPDNAVPYGFEALTTVAPLGTGIAATPTLITTRFVGNVDRRLFYGFTTDSTTNLSYLAPTVGTGAVGQEFNLATSVTGNEVNGTTPISLTNREHVSYRKFTVPLQGGFDGLNPAREIKLGGDIAASNTMGFDLSSAATSGSVAYKRAIDALANPDTIDLNLLVVPGAIHQLHPYITQAAVDLCERRADCFYLMDLAGLNTSISTVTSLAEALDTSYAAAYHPWVRVLDTNTNKLLWAPPSVVLPEVYAYNDRIGADFYAPAGLNRGGVSGAVGVKVRLNQTQRDQLYESKVNPIAQFPRQGISVWGQKTLQRRSSALDRINVRRLLIAIKKYVASSARYLVFEQNTEATRARFLNIVNPYLASIQQRSGLTAFRVVMDETNNTPDVIDRNILVGSIFLQPTRTSEFVKLDFNVLPTGASFDQE